MTPTGVDTNVLLRLLVDDDGAQAATAREFFQSRSPQFPVQVSWIALVELVWTLRSRYGYAVSDILTVVGELCRRPDVRIERVALVLDAVEKAKAGAGFSDALIALGNEAAGCDRTVTFDREVSRRLAQMSLLE
ncbi:hypothetical protein Sa4125_07660 [Aureimonas sp. SA4125]|uniref:PIN domain-containing protein n=1 Tax=Aureimonas sp. SA4125 TaxID=2826993 RepID=UPI001CC7935E|nr:type II toxin-antitoxin system VapC family toxin [Aureimonas sp. SA4125]BDA83224.1 hypothetical protein Sa4125_07660 [Aureimonas sp. SA4125]